MKKVVGLLESQVLQRTDRNISRTHISIHSEKNGDLKVSVFKGRTVLKGWGDKRITTIAKGVTHFCLEGIPVGGPYRIRFDFCGEDGSQRIVREFSNIQVGDVWMLAGQSNMEGIGHLEDTPKVNSKVSAFYMNDKWGMAKDPIHNISDAKAVVHKDSQRPNYIGVGPGVSFGQAMYKALKVPQGLICSAHGGSSMDQWNPKLIGERESSLYGAMYNRFVENGSNIRGLLWYQGESDAVDKRRANHYQKK